MSDARLERILGRIAADPALWADFLGLCDQGGRLAGTASEAAALDWAATRLAALPGGGTLRRDATPYAGWQCDQARLELGATGRASAATPLLGSAFTPARGLDAAVLDLGRGAPEDFARAGAAVAGRAVLVRHEFPFASWTIHRRRKLAAAQEAGAAAFLIVQPEPGIGPVSGSSGRAGGAGIPALGISAEAASLLSDGTPVRITITGADRPEAMTEALILDLPGRGPGRVVLSAHIDGHPLGESALDNATGVAAALALARAVAPEVAMLPRGLTIAFFSAEEWALAGSKSWLAGLDAATRRAMAFNLNLDSLCGSPRVTALTSDFPDLGPFLRGAARRAGFDLGLHLPLMSNSDHANFAAVGVPAARLVAGFDEPGSALRFLLTGADARALVAPGEMKSATLLAATLLWEALCAEEELVAGLGVR